jgi:putative ABC transport system ATP-binding protein
MDSPSLRGQRLVQTFVSGGHETRALRDLSVDLMPCQLTLVMGPSGCGKTTLLSVLSGLLPPTSGQVLFAGRDLYALSATQRREFRLRHVGFIFQGANLFPTLTVQEHLEMVLRWGEGVGAAEARRRTGEQLRALDLGGKEDLFPRQLSGGEQQRTAIGRALIKKPGLVFADEPTSALDWDRGKQVMAILRREACEQSGTVLVVSHDPRVMAFADRVLHLEDGVWKGDEAVTDPPPARVPQAPPDRGEERAHS